VAQRCDAAFSAGGIQSYLFEGALGELSARVGTYMDALTGGALTMELRPAATGAAAAAAAAKKKKRTKTKAAVAAKSQSQIWTADGSRDSDEDNDDSDEDNDDDAADVAQSTRGPCPPLAPPLSPAATSDESTAAAEKIEKVIHAHLPCGGRVPRSLRQLSGGERRRATLALALAYADLAASRGGVSCDLLVRARTCAQPRHRGLFSRYFTSRSASRIQPQSLHLWMTAP